MSDIANLRAALRPYPPGPPPRPSDIVKDRKLIEAAAKELLAQQEAGALVIVPDEDGDFPEWAVHEALEWKMGHRPDGLFNALRDAMPKGDL